MSRTHRTICFLDLFTATLVASTSTVNIWIDHNDQSPYTNIPACSPIKQSEVDIYPLSHTVTMSLVNDLAKDNSKFSN